MKGRNPTQAEKNLHDRIAQFGCVACFKDGHYSPHVSIHHIAGRTRPDAHKRVLPLCAGHHQDGTGNDKTMIAVHPFKARFEHRYGSQDELLDEVMGLIGVAA